MFSVYFYHTEEWTERNQQLLEATSLEIRRCPEQWILAGDFNMEPGNFGQYATMRDCQEYWSSQLHPLPDMECRFEAFDYFVVHGAIARQILEVCVLEDSGISPHHPVQMKLKHSFQGLLARVQATPRALPVLQVLHHELRESVPSQWLPQGMPLANRDEAEEISSLPSVVSIPQKPTSWCDNRCSEKALSFWQR